MWFLVTPRRRARPSTKVSTVHLAPLGRAGLEFRRLRGKPGEFDDRRRRSRSCPRAKGSGQTGRVADKKTRVGRPLAWGAGTDDEGSLQDLCRNWYVSTGAHVLRHEGRSRQDSGTPRYLPRRAPGCVGKDICHRARDCPNRPQLEKKMRRRFSRAVKVTGVCGDLATCVGSCVFLPCSSIGALVSDGYG